MAIFDNPTDAYNKNFLAAQTYVDTVRRNAAFNALRNTYGDVVGDPELAAQMQSYGQAEQMNPLLVEQQGLVNTGIGQTNDQRAAMNPMLLEQQGISNEQSQFNLDQGQQTADTASTQRDAAQMRGLLGSTVQTLGQQLTGVDDPTQRATIFDTQVAQLAPLLGADPAELEAELAPFRDMVMEEGAAALPRLQAAIDAAGRNGAGTAPLTPLDQANLEIKRAELEIKRSEADTKKAKAAEAEAEKTAKATQAGRALDEFESKNTIVFDAIDEAIRLANASPMSTGAAVNVPVLNQLPAVRDLAAQLKTIGASIGFAELQRMRENSPTGGALGQVSNFENELLQATQGPIAQDQSREQFIAGLEALRRVLTEGAERARTWYGEDYGSAAKATPATPDAAPDAPPEGVDPGLWEFLTPEERVLWR